MTMPTQLSSPQGSNLLSAVRLSITTDQLFYFYAAIKTALRKAGDDATTNDLAEPWRTMANDAIDGSLKVSEPTAKSLATTLYEIASAEIAKEIATIEIEIAKLQKAEWDESEHPRGAGGRFGSGDGEQAERPHRKKVIDECGGAQNLDEMPSKYRSWLLDNSTIPKSALSQRGVMVTLEASKKALIDTLYDEAQQTLRKEMEVVNAEIERLEKARRIDWGQHPNHRIADKIIDLYTPKLKKAMTKAITGIPQAIAGAQRKYVPTKVATKATGSDASDPAYEAAAEAVAQYMNISPDEAMGVLQMIYGDSFIGGTTVALNQIGSGAAISSALRGAETALDWSSWEPGWAEAANLAEFGGLQSLLDGAGITIKSCLDTGLDRLTSAIADGLRNGDSSQTIANALYTTDDAGKVTEDSIVSDNALMIATTETSRVMTQANIDSYQANGIAQYEWLAENDERTCLDCSDKDGEIFEVDDAASSGDTSSDGGGDASASDDTSADESDLGKADDGGGDSSSDSSSDGGGSEDNGTNQPPLHPNCRCVTLPVISTEGADTSREALSPEDDGEAYAWDEESQSWTQPSQQADQTDEPQANDQSSQEETG